MPERSRLGNSAARYARRVVDTTPLTQAVDHFADRLRAAPQSRLQRSAAPEALALARELARRTQAVEEPGSEPRQMPDAGMFAVADQILVAAHDLALVLSSAEEVAEAVRLVEEARQRAGV
ncbi:hypothetical protein ACE1SV_26280 [Streptomyces sp. E-15]